MLRHINLALLTLQKGIFQSEEPDTFVRPALRLCKVLFSISPPFAYIEKKRSEGKGGKEAMIAGLNKFLRIYYGKLTERYNSIDEQLNSDN